MTIPALALVPILLQLGSSWTDWGLGKDRFPIAVWLQDPRNAGRYKAAGFNLYVGLWKGPTEAQLEQLRQVGMPVICRQNAVGLSHINDPIIVGWMHEDEPDNAQPIPEGKGYGPPIPPTTILEDYNHMKAADPDRPVLLNLGQAVAWDGWSGRGTRTGHPEDYPLYVKGCDIASFDIYPVTHPHPEVSGNLWYVANGVQRLVQWAAGRVVWNCIECTRINSSTRKPTPLQVKAMVWMSIIHGSRGLIYFVHEWQPRFKEAALLDDPEMLAAVTDINRQIQALAPALLKEGPIQAVTVTSIRPDVPVAALAKCHEGSIYVFAVPTRDGTTEATFELAGLQGNASIEVMDEQRTIQVLDGRFQDRFGPWQVHLYRLQPAGH